MTRLNRLTRALSVALACTAPSGYASANQFNESNERPAVILPAFHTGNTGDTIRLESIEAKRLAHELLPIIASQTTYATIGESIALPGSSYVGVSIDFALEPQHDRKGICEERHASLYFRYDSSGVDERKIALSVNDGIVKNHTFQFTRWFGRYRRLPQSPLLLKPALSNCRATDLNTSDWKQADNISAFVSEEFRQSALFEAIKALQSAQIICVGVNGKKCAYSRDELLSIIRKTPPDFSQELLIPQQGTILVFRFAEKTRDVGIDYTVTMQRELNGKPRSLRIRFDRNVRPAI